MLPWPAWCQSLMRFPSGSPALWGQVKVPQFFFELLPEDEIDAWGGKM